MPVQYERFLVKTNSTFGQFGFGETQKDAERVFKQNDGQLKDAVVYRFSSKLPFSTKSLEETTENESRCSISTFDGSIQMLRCEHEFLGERKPLPRKKK